MENEWRAFGRRRPANLSLSLPPSHTHSLSHSLTLSLSRSLSQAKAFHRKQDKAALEQENLYPPTPGLRVCTPPTPESMF